MYSKEYTALFPTERDNGAALAVLAELPVGYRYEPYWESQLKYLDIVDNIIYLNQEWHYEISTSYFTTLSFSTSGQWSTRYSYFDTDGDGIENIPIKIVDQNGVEKSWFYVDIQFTSVNINNLSVTPIPFAEGVYGAVVGKIENIHEDFEIYIGSPYLEVDDNFLKFKDEYRYINERVATYDGTGWTLGELEEDSDKDYYSNIFLSRDSTDFAEARVEIPWSTFNTIFLSENVQDFYRQNIDDNIFLSSITSAFKWHNEFITYSFVPAGLDISYMSPSSEYGFTTEYSAEEKEVFRAAADLISSYANIYFVEKEYGEDVDKLIAKVPEIATPNNPHIDYAGGFSGGPYSSKYVMSQEAALNLDTHVHELGHTLGLEHPWEETESKTSKLPGIGEDAFDAGDYGNHSPYWTVMSYGNAIPDALTDVDMPAPALAVVDVAALQHMYGANLTTNLGNNEYRPSDDFQVIWDAGGVDSISFSTIGLSSVIDLRPADLSFDADGPGGMSFTRHDGKLHNILQIVPNAWIEDAIGGAGHDVIYGNELSNVLAGGKGNDTIDGGVGTDTVSYDGDQDAYTVTLGPSGVQVRDRRLDGNGTDTLTNIEFLEFDTGDFANFNLDQFGGATSLSEADFKGFIELYIAYFNRAPDAVGLNFWGTAYATGTTMEQMAKLFAPQDETLATYPEGTSNAEFATAVYNNVLGRIPDQAGFDFWVGVLDAGGVTRDQFILEVLRGVQDGSPDRQYLDNKVDVGAYFAVHKGMSDTGNAAAAMQLYDGTDTSIQTVKQAIDAYHLEAMDPVTGEFLLPLVGVLDDPFV